MDPHYMDKSERVPHKATLKKKKKKKKRKKKKEEKERVWFIR